MTIAKGVKKPDLSGDFSKKMKFNRSVLEALIYFASRRGKKILPTIGEFILSEVVAGTIEYVTGREYLFTYHRSEDGGEHNVPAQDWEWKTNLALEKALGQAGEKLNPALGTALKELVFLRHSTDAMGDSGWGSDLFGDWELICPVIMRSTFSLSVGFVERVKKQLPKLDAETLCQCKAIAKLMEKYIAEDVELIRKKYHW